MAFSVQLATASSLLENSRRAYLKEKIIALNHCSNGSELLQSYLNIEDVGALALRLVGGGHLSFVVTSNVFIQSFKIKCVDDSSEGN